MNVHSLSFLMFPNLAGHKPPPLSAALWGEGLGLEIGRAEGGPAQAA